MDAKESFQIAWHKAIQEFPQHAELLAENTDTMRLCLWFYGSGGVDGVSEFQRLLNQEVKTDNYVAASAQKANLQ